MSSDALAALARRRMCRDFTTDQVDPGALSQILEAALGAPAAGNTHGLDLVVLQGTDTARYWDVTLPADRRQSFRWPGLLRAPVLVVPYVDPGAYLRRYSERDKAGSRLGEGVHRWTVPYWFVDGGAAVMAMLAVAEVLGLGALLFGQFEREPAVREALGVPEQRRAVGTVAIGHRSPQQVRASSAGRGRPDMADHVHDGSW